MFLWLCLCARRISTGRSTLVVAARRLFPDSPLFSSELGDYGALKNFSLYILCSGIGHAWDMKRDLSFGRFARQEEEEEEEIRKRRRKRKKEGGVKLGHWEGA